MADKKESVSSERKDLFKYTSVQRISKIPVVESGYKYVSTVYARIRNSNKLIQWSLGNMEGGIQLAVDKTMPTVLLLDLPLTVVDSIICKGLDTVSVAIPAINYPPNQLVNISKNYVNSNLIIPVLKRADSVKQLGLNEANRVGEIAASRLDNALDIADKYVDRYLPDSSDVAGNKKDDEKEGESKTTQAIHHMNRLGKKLQRRLTKRTLMEAEALKKGSQDIAQTLIYLADLLLRDPKGFGDKVREVWKTLSEDEPENQVPPANLEQLVALLVRESARRAVHVANFVVSTLPSRSAHAFHFTLHHVQYYTNYFLKVIHLEGVKGIAYATSTERLSQLRTFILHFLEILGSHIKETKGNVENFQMRPIASVDSNSNNSLSNQEESATEGETQSTPKSSPESKSEQSTSSKKSKTKSPPNKKDQSPPKYSSSTNLNGSQTSLQSNTDSFTSNTNTTPYASPS